MKERIRKIRKDHGMTQETFGAAIGSTRGMVTTYENGTIPTLATRMLICEKFHVNQTWLETGEGEPYKSGGMYEVLRALDSMPALQEAFAKVLPKLTVQDMKTINELLEKFIESQK